MTAAQGASATVLAQEIERRLREVSNPQRAEHEPFIRKAIGWALRDTGKRRPALVTDWLLPRTARTPRLVVRGR